MCIPLSQGQASFCLEGRSMYFYVNGTYRRDPCNHQSGILGLVLTERFNGFMVHDLLALKPIADAGRLWVDSAAPCGSVQVRIFWSSEFNRYVATTRADGKQCNNLLSLPIYYPASSQGTVTNYQTCPL